MQVGGRSVVSASIRQVIELRASDDERFARLLELLGETAGAADPGKTLVFVNSQDKCSTLFQQLLNYGYANQMLHGGMQQVCLYLDLFHLLSTRERSDRGNPQSTHSCIAYKTSTLTGMAQLNCSI